MCEKVIVQAKEIYIQQTVIIVQGDNHISETPSAMYQSSQNQSETEEHRLATWLQILTLLLSDNAFRIVQTIIALSLSIKCY